MANWKETLETNGKPYTLHFTNGHVDTSIGTVNATTFICYIDAIDGDEPPMEHMSEEQITARLTANEIDPNSGWR